MNHQAERWFGRSSILAERRPSSSQWSAALARVAAMTAAQNDTALDAVLARIAANMLNVPPGTSALKDEGTGRRWTVELGAFRMGRFTVTQEEYRAVLDGTFSSDARSSLPAVDISWLEAVRFCNALSTRAGLRACYDPNGVHCDWLANGYRLPSEAEWEYVCRAGSDAVRYGDLEDIAWYRENSGEQLHRGGEKSPNAWGFFDLIGNVWEWCWDLFDADIYGPYRVFRGGGWYDAAFACRASCRRKSHPTFAIDDLGFRIAQSLV